MARIMAIKKLVCVSFQNLLIVEKLLKLVGLSQRIQILSFILKKKKNARLANDKALHALCQALSPSKFTKILNCGTAQETCQILETTYEGTTLVKSAKLQMLISRFEEIKMLEDETFREFYSKMSDLRNSMVSLGKSVSDVKLI